MIKAAFFDVDGTLFSHTMKKFPESTMEALRLLKKKGIKLFLSTGRSYMEAMKLPWEDVVFEEKFYDIIFNSKYKSLLLGEDKITVNYQIVNEILFFVYAKLKVDYSLSQILVMLCEYCGINIQTMWKKLSSYAQMEILKELREFSKLPKENDEINLF